MKYKAEIDIMPHPELLDPQGKAISASMHHLDLGDIADVRVGKHVTLTIEADSEAAAGAFTEKACKKLLANPVIEYYEYTLHPAEN